MQMEREGKRGVEPEDVHLVLFKLHIVNNHDLL